MKKGDRVDGKYVIERELGSGGMGAVYLAFDEELHRHVALKFLHRGSIAEGEDSERFLREARALSALDHPNIGTVFSVGTTEEGERYLCLAYYPGETLAGRIERGPLSLADVLRLGTQIAQGLERANEAGIIHRDLKPANILVTDREEIKIVDFGLARRRSDSKVTQTGTTLGTVAYMSPEQIHAQGVDHRSDLWSLGAVLHEMTTGRRAFPEDRLALLVRSIAEGRFEPPSQEGQSGVESRLWKLIGRLLMVRPSDRPGSARDVVRELRSIRSELAAGSHTDTMLGSWSPGGDLPVRAESATQWLVEVAQRRPGWTRFLGVAALVMVILAMASLLWFGDRADLVSGGLRVELEPLEGDVSSVDPSDWQAALVSSFDRGSRGVKVVFLTPEEVGRNPGAGTLRLTVKLSDEGERLGARTRLIHGGASGLVEQVEYWGPAGDVEAWLEEAASEIVFTVENAKSVHLGLADLGSEALDAYGRAAPLLRADATAADLQLARGLLAEAFEQSPRSIFLCGELAHVVGRLGLLTRDAELLDEAQTLLAGFPEDRWTETMWLAQAVSSADPTQKEEAIRALRHVITTSFDPSVGQIYLADHLREDGRTDEAEQLLRMAVRARPGSWNPRLVLGTFLFGLGDVEGAREAWEGAAERSPGWMSSPLENLGVLELAYGSPQAALTFYERVPRPIVDPYLAANMLTANFLAGRLQEAERWARVAVRLAPYSAMHRRNLGDVLRAQGREVDALSAFHAGLELLVEEDRTKGLNASGRTMWALLLARVGDCEQSLKVLEKTPEGELPMQPKVRRGMALVSCGDDAKGIEDLRWALENGWSKSFLEAELRLTGRDPEFLGGFLRDL